MFLGFVKKVKTVENGNFRENNTGEENGESLKLG
jgi:hypothetical protein